MCCVKMTFGLKKNITPKYWWWFRNPKQPPVIYENLIKMGDSLSQLLSLPDFWTINRSRPAFLSVVMNPMGMFIPSKLYSGWFFHTIKGDHEKAKCVIGLRVAGASIHESLYPLDIFGLSPFCCQKWMELWNLFLTNKVLGQWLFLVPLIGGRLHIIPQKAIYKWYISGIYCQLGDYISPTTY